MNKKIQVISLLSLFTFAVMPGSASAEEIVITGNGAESVSTVQSSQNNTTNVSQNNDMNVDNNLDVNASTGNNTVSDNTGGDTSVQTGNVGINTSVSNTGNVSTVTQECCPALSGSNGGSVVISGNGSGSNNAVNNSFSSQTSIQINQNANITNNINGRAITGYNTANDNTDGDVFIKTGNIKVSESVNNKVNHANVKLAKTVAALTMVKIAGNGAYSDNEVNLDFNDDVNVDIDNNADIINNSTWDLITGYNDASDNTGGDVSVITGDIKFTSEITNVANISKVEIVCCEKEKEKVHENLPPKPVTTVTEKHEDKGVGGGGQVLGAAAEKLLPVTGNAGFFFALIANLLFLLFGVMLRLRAGRSPGFSVA